MGMILGIVLGILGARFVMQDGKKRGMNPIGWAILTFLALIIGLPLYLIFRKPLLEAPIDVEGFGKQEPDQNREDTV